MSVQNVVPSYQEELEQLVGQLEGMLPAAQFSVFNNDAVQLAKEYEHVLKVKVGDKTPIFALSNAIGQTVNLQDLLNEGAVVVTFYRGTWCPYCNLQLRQLQHLLPQFKEAGAQLVAISPQTPDHSLSMKEKNELEFHVLSDPGNEVARQFTTVFKYGDAPLQAMADLGYDFNSFYSDDSGEIPVPATFVISKKGIITYAASEGGDYRLRPEPKAILEALA
ncbi:MAG: peroxiredoxin-like family protein [Bacteroidota bacterium]